MVRKRTPESYILSAVLDYLAVKRVFAVRMNSGAMKVDNRFLRFGAPGMADILAFNRDGDLFMPTWIETKAPGGKQSLLQKQFQKMVEDEGHQYIIAYGIQDVEKSL
jgi:hypothetical protein